LETKVQKHTEIWIRFITYSFRSIHFLRKYRFISLHETWKFSLKYKVDILEVETVTFPKGLLQKY